MAVWTTMDIYRRTSLLIIVCVILCNNGISSAVPSRTARHLTDLPASDSHSTNGQTIHRMKQMILQGGNKIIDFENGRHMDANDEAVQHIAAGPAANETIQSYIQRNCSSCLVREEAKWARIERIKADLLQKLGFKHPPNTTARDLPPIVPHLQGLLIKWGFQSDNILNDAPMDNNRIDLQPEEYGAQTEKVFSFASEPPAILGLPTGKPIAYFKFSPDTMNNYVEDAILRFYVKKPDNVVTDSTMVFIIRLYSVKDRSGEISEIDQKIFKKDLREAGHWDKFHVTKLVRHWFAKPERNFGIMLEVVYKGENLVVFPESAQSAKHNMYLEISTRDGARTRRKREAPKLDCQEKDNETRCCRYPLVIDFESFGWDWVIAPKKYLAYYCSGECPFRHLQRYLHTHLVQQANPKGNVGPCCYPTQMAPILMVYFNENKEVLVSKVPGMVVTRCGCA